MEAIGGPNRDKGVRLRRSNPIRVAEAEVLGDAGEEQDTFGVSEVLADALP